MQRDEFLPLRVIRQELATGDFTGRRPERRGPEAPRRVGRRAGDVVHARRSWSSRPGSARASCASCRTSASSRPSRSGGRTVYDETDLEIVRAAAELSQVRRRWAQPARLSHLGRPRGGAARAAARRPAALAQPGAAKGGGREPREPRRGLRPSQAPAAGPGPAAPEVDRQRLARAPSSRQPAMPRVSRSQDDRRATRDGSGTLVSDPHSLPRWWPRALRVEDVRDPSGEPRSVDDRARDRARGRGARRLSLHRARPRASATPGSRRSTGLRSSASSGPRSSRSSSPASRRGRRVTLTGDERAARALAAGLGDDARRLAAPARRGAGRDRAGAGRSPSEREAPTPAPRPGEVVGLGDPEQAPRAAARGDRDAARASSATATPSERVELEGVELPAPRRCPARSRRSRRAASVLAAHEDSGAAARPGRSYPDLIRLRRGRPERAPDAVVMPADRRRGRGAARGLRAATGSRWSPSAAGPASSAASSRCAGPHGRVIALDLRRLRGVERRPRLADGDARPRPARARGRGGARRPGADAGPLPAVVRVRDDRRLRRDPLGRSGIERLRALRRARHRLAMATPAGELRTLATPHTAAGPGAARAGARLGGRPGRDHRGHGAGARRPPRCGATRPGSSPTSPPARELVRSLAQADALPASTRLSDEAETRVSLGARRDERTEAERCSTPTCACAGGAAAAW